MIESYWYTEEVHRSDATVQSIGKGILRPIALHVEGNWLNWLYI